MALIAYPGGAQQRDRNIALMQAHSQADELVKGRYWEGGKGCAVGCILHDYGHSDTSDHMAFEPLFGVPVALAMLQDTIFENLPNAESQKWPARFWEAIQPGAPVIWMHCASLGEFEQGRPLLEHIRKEYPGYRILLTFFSPSGYEVRKDYTGADWVFYLPMDGAVAARRFLDIVSPALVIFVKYEFWYYYLKKLKYRNTPLLLVSALFREKMSFFKWYGGVQRKILSRFDHLFVQLQGSTKDISIHA